MRSRYKRDTVFLSAPPITPLLVFQLEFAMVQLSSSKLTFSDILYFKVSVEEIQKIEESLAASNSKPPFLNTSNKPKDEVDDGF